VHHAFDPRLRLSISYRDQTLLGSAVSGRVDDVLRKLFAPVVAHWSQHGIGSTITHSESLMSESRGGLDVLFEGPEQLAPEFLFPDPEAVRPLELVLSAGANREVVSLEDRPGDLAEAFAGRGMSALARTIALSIHRLLGASPEPDLRRAEVGATYVGHATAILHGKEASVAVDPFLAPEYEGCPARYRPLSLAEMGPIDAVVITHAHPDHYDVPTLLRFGPDMPIFVPALERESVLSIDTRRRLTELGFNDVRPLCWWSSANIGDVEITAMPFYGEQPAVRRVLAPHVRNAGNTYFIRAGGVRYAFLADSGVDPSGDSVGLAEEARARVGEVDVLFGGYRGFATYPIHYLFSSVARFFPFVPESSRGVRQKIMNDAEDLIDVAETWNAGVVVPYADGGAPWYWKLGLGPALDGGRVLSVAVDPPPSAVRRASEERSGSVSEGLIPGRVPVLLLRPTQHLSWRHGGPTVDFVGDRAWPYPDI
jgi:L-ascorbate metabolism protein UlaG (beta-lactamase superfamily)